MKMSANGRKTIGACLEEGIHFLQSKQVPEPRISAEALLSFVLGRPPISLYVDSDIGIDSLLESQYQNLLTKRARRVPLQYLLGMVSFRNASLTVGEGCFIPRPETELLIDLLLSTCRSEAIMLLDIGTGSGNIATGSALERPNWRFVATDLSSQALKYALGNARKNRVAEQIRFVQTDLWNGLNSRAFDVVVSNPPYLSAGELDSLQPEVAFEPREALDGGEDGLDVYRRVIPRLCEVLKPGGPIFFEIGLGQAKAVSDLLVENGFHEVKVSVDDSGIERVITARRLCHG